MTRIQSPSHNPPLSNEVLTRPRFERAEAMSNRSNLRLRPCRDTQTAEAVHDFRNTLGTVSTLSELALLQVSLNVPVNSTLELIRKACADAKELCDRLIDDSRKASRGVELVNLSTLVKSMAPLLSTCVPAESALSLDLTDGTPLAIASPGEIRQVLMNLVKNAAEALHDRPGKVTVSTGLVALEAMENLEVESGISTKTEQYSYLTVSDSGCGMDEATKACLFEHPFTTKENGHGLGMASVQRIVHGSGGAIQVRSQVGVGTQVRVLFPPVSQVLNHESCILPI